MQFQSTINSDAIQPLFFNERFDFDSLETTSGESSLIRRRRVSFVAAIINRRLYDGLDAFMFYISMHSI